MGEFRLQKVKNLTCLMQEILEKHENVDKENILDIQINHRISCWQEFAAIFLQMVALFEGFYTFQ
jgi:hypothetical protein